MHILYALLCSGTQIKHPTTHYLYANSLAYPLSHYSTTLHSLKHPLSGPCSLPLARHQTFSYCTLCVLGFSFTCLLLLLLLLQKLVYIHFKPFVYSCQIVCNCKYLLRFDFIPLFCSVNKYLQWLSVNIEFGS